MDYDEVASLLDRQISQCTSMAKGLEEIARLTGNGIGKTIVGIDHLTMLREFVLWLNETIAYLPLEIRSLGFGLFTASDPAVNNGEESILVYAYGSKATPTVDKDCWADHYFRSTKYLSFAAFDHLLERMILEGRRSGMEEVLIFNGIMNLLVMVALPVIEGLTMKPQGVFRRTRKELVVAVGFDSGDMYTCAHLRSRT